MLLCVSWFRARMLAPALARINLSQQQFKKKRNELEVKYKCSYLVQKDSSCCSLSLFVRFSLDSAEEVGQRLRTGGKTGVSSLRNLGAGVAASSSLRWERVSFPCSKALEYIFTLRRVSRESH